MAEKMGADSVYPSRELPLFHRRMYITKELLELRRGLLREALEEEGLPEILIRHCIACKQQPCKQHGRQYEGFDAYALARSFHLMK